MSFYSLRVILSAAIRFSVDNNWTPVEKKKKAASAVDINNAYYSVMSDMLYPSILASPPLQ